MNSDRTISKDRFLKRPVVLKQKRRFLGRDHLDRETPMNALTFEDEDGRRYLWNTRVRNDIKQGRHYLLSATPLMESCDYLEVYLPTFRVTRGKVYDAPAES